jgi:hypothetical protein
LTNKDKYDIIKYNDYQEEINMENKEMDLLLSEKEMSVGGKMVTVKRIALLDTIRIAAKISDLVAKVLGNPEIFDSALNKIMYRKEEASQEEINGVRMTGIIDLLGLIGDDSVDIIRYIILKSTNMTEEEVENVDCLEGVDLLTEVYKINKGFFVNCWSKLNANLTPKKKRSKKEK